MPVEDVIGHDEFAAVGVPAHTLAGDLGPSGDDDRAHLRIVDANGVPIFTTNTNPADVDIDPFTNEDAPAGTDVGFSAPVRREFQSGVKNGDFSAPPPDPDLPIGDDNPLPYWRFVQASGSACRFYWSSSQFISVHMDSGAADDEAYLEQYVPVASTWRSMFRTRWVVSLEQDSNSIATSPKLYVNAVQCVIPPCATTGTTTTEDARPSGLPLSQAHIGVVDGDTTAAGVGWVRLRIGIKRDSAADATTVDGAQFHDVWREGDRTDEVLVMAKSAGPTSWDVNAYHALWYAAAADANAVGNLYAMGVDDVAKPITPSGWQHDAFPYGVADVASSATLGLSAVAGGNGGALAVPVPAHAPMTVYRLAFLNGSTSLAREGEGALYVDNGDATFDRVTGSSVTWSFTPSAISWETASLSSAIIIPPGLYWFVLRNTSTARTLQVRRSGLTEWAGKQARFTTAAGSLGTTIDISGWSGAGSRVHYIGLEGGIGAEGAPW